MNWAPANLNVVMFIPKQSSETLHRKSRYVSMASQEEYGAVGRLLVVILHTKACIIREAAYIMNIYVNPKHAGHTGSFNPSFHENLEEGLTILELGSGAGIVGYHLSQMFSKPKDMIILTDLPEVLRFNHSITLQKATTY